MLDIQNLSVQFGGLKAVDNFNMKISNGELVGLIGPNGAGKTTVFNLITGVYAPSEGSILLQDALINKVNTSARVELGLARTFQNIRLFDYLTVADNVIVACNHMMSYGFTQGMFRLNKYWKEEKLVRERALELLDFFDMADYANNQASSLPYGYQRKLEIVRAMATNPKLLLLDEPAAGMNPVETEELMGTIAKIRKEFNLSILLIEHDMNLVLGICERLIVLDRGIKIAEGNPQEVVNDSKVITAYLGEDIDE